MQTQITSLAERNKIIHPDPILAEYGCNLTFPERFFSKVIRGFGCWEWTGAVNHLFGTIRASKGNQTAMRAYVASWLLHNGAIPEGKKLVNLCPVTNALCTNPNHWKIEGEEPPTPSLEQLERAARLCLQSGRTLIEIESWRHCITPQWMIDLGFSENFSQRWHEKVLKTEHCWLWLGARCSDGYGSIGTTGDSTRDSIGAHRAGYMLYHGPIPEGTDVLHNCTPLVDNPSCVCPQHLWAGTDNANTQDAIQKCRARNNSYWYTKLNAEQVREIRRLRASGMSQKEIAAKFHIEPPYVSAIANRKTWGWLE